MMQLKKLKILLVLIALMLTVSWPMNLSADEKSDLKKIVELEATIIKLEGDLGVSDQIKEHYKKLYDSEKFWSEVKNIGFIIAMIAISGGAK